MATTRCREGGFLISNLQQFFNVFLPLQDAGYWLLTTIYGFVAGSAVVQAIGAYGVAIIVMTIIIRVALAPLQQFQLVTQRRSMAEQRKLAPQVAELRKKYKKDPQRLNSETMKLYQEHGINPLGGLVGCLPLVVQMPILSALYFVFRNRAPQAHMASHFLFVPNLNDFPTHHLLIAGIPYVPTVAYLVFPLLAAITTLIQSRMLQMPPAPNPTEQEQQTQQMQRTMVLISPLMIGWFALQVPAGLGLYWFIGNCVSIIQQSFVVGWGNLWPSRAKPLPGASVSLPSKGSTALQKNGPPPRPTNNYNSGNNSKAKKPKNRARSDRT